MNYAALPGRRHGSKRLHRFQRGLDARDFVRAEQIGLAQRGQHGKERLGAPDFLAEKFKGVRQRVADGKAEFTQPERVQKDVHLMPDAHRAVLQIAVIETQAGIEDDFFHAVALRDINLPRRNNRASSDRIGAQVKVAHLADVPAPHETNDDGGIVRGDHTEHFGRRRAAGEIQNVCAGFETGPRDGGR